MADNVRYCEVCSCQIEPDRLDAVSNTRLCTKHAQEILKYGGEFTGTGSHDNVGRGIKILTAGVTVIFQRNDEAMQKLKDAYAEAQWDKEKAKKDGATGS